MSLVAQIAWRNLWRHPRRTGLTIGAIGFSTALLVLMSSIQVGTYRAMIEASLGLLTGHMQVQAPGYNDSAKMRLTVADAENLRARIAALDDELQTSVRATAFALVASAERSLGALVQGVDPKREPTVSTLPGLLREGRYLVSGDEVVIGRLLADNLKVGPGDELTLMGTGYDSSFAAAVLEVVGVFEAPNPELGRNLLQIPLGAFQQIFAMEDRAHAIVIRTPSLDHVAEYLRDLQPLLADTGLVVLDWDALLPGLRATIESDLVGSAVAYIVLTLLVAFSVLNTQLMSVMERAREFGVQLALGLAPGLLARLIALETALLTLLGCIAGLALGMPVVLLLQQVGFTVPGAAEMMSMFNLSGRMYPALSLWSVLLVPALIFVAAQIASLYPARRVYRLQPVQAMQAVY